MRRDSNGYHSFPRADPCGGRANSRPFHCRAVSMNGLLSERIHNFVICLNVFSNARVKCVSIGKCKEPGNDLIAGFLFQRSKIEDLYSRKSGCSRRMRSQRGRKPKAPGSTPRICSDVWRATSGLIGLIVPAASARSCVSQAFSRAI